MRLGQAADQPLGAPGNVLGVGDQGELVAAQPGHQLIGAGVGPQAVADLREEEVAGVVAQGVVEVLEAVEVDDEERDRPAMALRRLQPLGELGGEGAAIDQAGERVGLRQAQRQFALGFQLRHPRREIGMSVDGVGHAREGPLVAKKLNFASTRRTPR